MGRHGYPVYVDNQYYSSLFSAAVDNDFSVSMFIQKVLKAESFPIYYKHHTVILADKIPKKKRKANLKNKKRGNNK